MNFEALNNIEDRMVQLTVTLSEVEIAERRRLQESFWKKLHIGESILKQKSGHRRVRERDNNSRYFNATMKAKFRRNSIIEVKNPLGLVVESATKVKQVTKVFFASRFQRPSNPRPCL